jgi:hypothetical protein
MNKVLRRSTANETIMRRRSLTTVARSYVGRGLGAALAILLGQLSAPQAKAGDYDVGSIHIADTWARATPKGASSGAGYMTVTNNGTAPDRLSCVSSDTSAKCQIHSMTMENGTGPGCRRGRRYDDAGRRHDADEAPQMGACGLCVTI